MLQRSATTFSTCFEIRIKLSGNLASLIISSVARVRCEFEEYESATFNILTVVVSSDYVGSDYVSSCNIGLQVLLASQHSTRKGGARSRTNVPLHSLLVYFIRLIPS